MNIVNAARHAVVEITSNPDKEGREHLLVVFKATYRIPSDGKAPRPLLPPQPLAMRDLFTGEPGLSAPLYENDFAAHKPRCDVVFNAHAHAPGGKPITELDVAVRVGSMSKAVHVVGDRVWEKDLLVLRAGLPKPFMSMPLHSGRAFGGSLPLNEGAVVRYDTFAENPFGRGYSSRTGHAVLHGLHLPNLERKGRPVTRPDIPMSPVYLSPTPRNALSRLRYAGTYDRRWREQVCPFPPEDFDDRFFQSAPEDQQIPFPQGGEEVTLINLMADRPEASFRLPRLDTLPVRVLRRDYTEAAPEPHADTLYFEPDEGRFSVVWRTTLPLGSRGLREIRTVTVGQVCQKWWEGVRLGASGCRGCAAKGAASAPPEGCPETPESPAIDAARLELGGEDDNTGGES